MAMVKCPECQQEISDKAKKCIHCGKEFEVKVEDKAKKVCPECGNELDQDADFCNKCGCPLHLEQEKTEVSKEAFFVQNKKKILIGGVTAACVIVLAVIGISINNSRLEKKAFNDYIYALVKSRELMHDGSAQAELMTDLTAEVWKNAIYEETDKNTDKYVRPNGSSYNDFDTAIKLLYYDDDTIIITSEIEGSRILVKDNMKKLQDPPKDLDRCYETINDMYDAYLAITELALSPSGNYTSFTESTNKSVSEFAAAYRKLDSQIPDKK